MVVVVAAMVVREEEELAGGSRVCRCSGVAMMVALRRRRRWFVVVVRGAAMVVRRGDDGTLPWLTRCGEDGGGRCSFVVVVCGAVAALVVVSMVRDGGAVAGEIGSGGCVEGGREIRVRVSCVRWRR
ncbi:hypothetical protein DEO72_LG10g1521 [Vigna unguiculata]|uniref:Uncharacterized protein n=1 Tax=Vigna unguiculata TaxID=3917 RepID=A0A4D6N8Y5_VIGUN|nr:hypothetical protein DEO72_LG10g1521 [Vigna unguiculata]